VREAIDEPGPRTRYIAYLQGRVNAAASQAPAGATSRSPEPELQWLRERLNSPRYRIADTIARFAQRIPILWPAIVGLTDTFLRWEVRRRENPDRANR
jgi:hypothetical protein